MSCPEVESSDQRCNTLQRIEEVMVVAGPWWARMVDRIKQHQTTHCNCNWVSQNILPHFFPAHAPVEVCSTNLKESSDNSISTTLRVLWCSNWVALRQFPSQHIEFAKPKKSSGSLIALLLDIPKVKLSCWTHSAIFQPWMMSWSFLPEAAVIKRLPNYKRISVPLVLAVDDLQHVQPASRPLPSSVPVTHWASRLQIGSAWKDPSQPAYFEQSKTWFDNLPSAACPSNTTSAPQNTFKKDKGKFCVMSVYKKDGTLSLPQKEALDLPVLRFKVWVNSLCKMQNHVALSSRYSVSQNLRQHKSR